MLSPIVALLLAAPLVAGFALARSYRQPRLAWTAIALLLGIWLIALRLTETGWHDADGWVDCWPHCSALQHGTGTALFVAPLLVTVAAIFATVATVRHAKQTVGT